MTAVSATAIAQAGRDYIYIVGSSTVYPFATVVAGRFGRGTDFKTPKVESTGSGGGLKLFCEGVGVDHPDITNSSRAIKQSEVDNCASNGVTGIVEVKIGYDGIVIGNAIDSTAVNLTRTDIFLALAKMVPGESDGELIEHPYETWADVNPEVILMDEPYSALDPIATARIEDLMDELSQGYAIVIVTHSMQQAARVSKRVAYFHLGLRELAALYFR